VPLLYLARKKVVWPARFQREPSYNADHLMHDDCTARMERLRIMTITMALDLTPPCMLLQMNTGPSLHSRHFVFSEIEVTLLAALVATPLECS
jgi:hypothetical protein